MTIDRLRDRAPSWLKVWYRDVWVPWQRRRNAKTSAFGALVTDRKRWLFETLPPDAAAYQYDIFAKESQRRLARRLGLATAEVLLAKAPLDEAWAFVEAQRLDRFVIKPNLSHNSVGFRPLVRTEGGFRNLRSGKVQDAATVLYGLKREYAGQRNEDVWMIEELLLPADGSDGPVHDYKFYCFGGRVEVIFHGWRVHRPPWRHRNWYARDWTPVVVSVKGPNKAPPRVPERADELIEVAERAAGALCYPFVRMDLYDTSRGVVFGEFTPGPGGRHNFLPEFDARYARLWTEAADDIAEGIRSGRIVPLTYEPGDRSQPG